MIASKLCRTRKVKDMPERSEIRFNAAYWERKTYRFIFWMGFFGTGRFCLSRPEQSNIKTMEDVHRIILTTVFPAGRLVETLDKPSGSRRLPTVTGSDRGKKGDDEHREPSDGFNSRAPALPAR